MTKRPKKVKQSSDQKITNQPVNIYKNRLKPRSENQRKYIESIKQNTVTFCQGLAGSGKTHIAVGMAIEALLSEQVGKIIITRPVLEAGERIGYLPGTAEEKLHPYLLPIVDEILYFINMGHYTALKLNNKIEVVPLGLMRGRNFHNSFIVADECQNASYDQLKMLLTRVGRNSKIALTGDIKQSDLNKNLQGGFAQISKALQHVDSIGLSILEASDIVINPIIAKILEVLDKEEI